MGENKRLYGIDLLRMLSMFGIVMLHMLGHGGILSNVPFMSIKYVLAWLLEIICFSSVNCFGLISGFVGLESKFKWKRLINLWFQIVFYTLSITLIMSIIKPETVGIRTWIYALFPITTSQYWYLTAYVGLFVFTPLLNKAIENVDRKYMKMFFYVCICFLWCCSMCIDATTIWIITRT